MLAFLIGLLIIGVGVPLFLFFIDLIMACMEEIIGFIILGSLLLVLVVIAYTCGWFVLELLK